MNMKNDDSGIENSEKCEVLNTKRLNKEWKTMLNYVINAKILM